VGTKRLQTPALLMRGVITFDAKPGSLRLDAGASRNRLAFLASERRFRWSGARLRDVRPARRWGKQWKAALAALRSPGG
jgi:hypothetical protein